MFITHFTGTAYCNEFSLASDDPNGHPFNDVFVEQYRLGRCKHTKVVHPKTTLQTLLALIGNALSAIALSVL